MNSANKGRAIACLLAITITLSGCKKILDKIKDHFDDDDPHTTDCRIAKITTSSQASADRVLSLQYNHHGDPTLVTYNWENFFQDTTKYFFRYDSQNRLTDLIETDKKNQYYMWHKYAYQGQRAIRDSIFQSAAGPFSNIDSVDRPIEQGNQFFGVIVYDIIYDSQDRIIQDTGRYIIFPAEPPYDDLNEVYRYDSAGNKVINPLMPYPYDNKKSIYRTNKIWQFIHRDYSENNSREAGAYNEAGYPTHFSGIPGETKQWGSLLSATLFNAVLEYDCGH